MCTYTFTAGIGTHTYPSTYTCVSTSTGHAVFTDTVLGVHVYVLEYHGVVHVDIHVHLSTCTTRVYTGASGGLTRLYIPSQVSQTTRVAAAAARPCCCHAVPERRVVHSYVAVYHHRQSNQTRQTVGKIVVQTSNDIRDMKKSKPQKRQRK